MKKIILLVAFISIYTISIGQNLNEKRAKYFTEAAAKEFNLSDEQKKELLTTRTEYLKSMTNLNQQAKNGDITEDEQKDKTKEVNKDFKIMMTKLTGKTEKELEPFFIRMREELKNVK